jgi:hypothetical protein
MLDLMTWTCVTVVALLTALKAVSKKADMCGTWPLVGGYVSPLGSEHIHSVATLHVLTTHTYVRNS